jgi:hypothetical protein
MKNITCFGAGLGSGLCSIFGSIGFSLGLRCGFGI